MCVAPQQEPASTSRPWKDSVHFSIASLTLQIDPRSIETSVRSAWHRLERRTQRRRKKRPPRHCRIQPGFTGRGQIWRLSCRGVTLKLNGEANDYVWKRPFRRDQSAIAAERLAAIKARRRSVFLGNTCCTRIRLASFLLPAGRERFACPKHAARCAV